jgi:hypothetical protein
LLLLPLAAKHTNIKAIIIGIIVPLKPKGGISSVEQAEYYNNFWVWLSICHKT